MYEAARAEHYKKVIEPALRDKKWVLCDRFTDSTLAYQGAARGLDTKMIVKLNDFATEGRQPDITILLDLPVEVGLARAKDPNKFEAEGIAFQNKVRKAYHALAKKDPKRFEVIPVEGASPEEVCQMAVIAIVEKAQALKAQAAKGKKK